MLCHDDNTLVLRVNRTRNRVAGVAIYEPKFSFVFVLFINNSSTILTNAGNCALHRGWLSLCRLIVIFDPWAMKISTHRISFCHHLLNKIIIPYTQRGIFFLVPRQFSNEQLSPGLFPTWTISIWPKLNPNLFSQGILWGTNWPGKVAQGDIVQGKLSEWEPSDEVVESSHKFIAYTLTGQSSPCHTMWYPLVLRSTTPSSFR